MTTNFSQYRLAAHPDGRNAMRLPAPRTRRRLWGVAHPRDGFKGWHSDADLASEGFRPAHLLTDLTDSLAAGVEALGIPAWEAYPDEMPAGVPVATVWDDGDISVNPRGEAVSTPARGWCFRRFLLVAPSRPEGAAPVQSALAAAGVEVTPEQADALAKAGVRAPETTP